MRLPLSGCSSDVRGNVSLAGYSALPGKQMQRWSVDIIRGNWTEHLGSVEAPDRREAYRLAIEKFNVPIEQQNRLFVAKMDKDRRGLNV